MVYNAFKILLVAAHHASLDLLIAHLINADFQVFITEDGSSALEKLNELQPDLILLDMVIVGMDGFEVCQALKANPQTRDIPVIFLSARDETVDKVKGFAVGGVDYITKPLDEIEVLARVRTHLQLAQTYRALREENYKLQQRITYQATAGKQGYAPRLAQVPTDGRPLLSLTLLGPFQLAIRGEVRTDFRSDTVRALLAYLVLEGQTPLERAYLAEFFWPTYLPHTRLNSLRVALHNLRQLLTPFEALLVTDRKQVQFYVEPTYVWCDALDLATGSFDRGRPAEVAPATTTSLFLAELAAVESAPFQQWRRQKQALYTPHGVWLGQ